MEGSGRMKKKKEGDQILMSLVPRDKVVLLLQRLLDEAQFLSDGGIRALSKYHQDHPYKILIENIEYQIQYDPGDSTSDFYGGNSNWRGPVWMPINYIIISSIRRFRKFLWR